jgi:uncharacterized protein YbbC (DUF1343 family)
MIRTGLEVLLHERLDLLRGRRVGLVSHPAAVLPNFAHALDALLAAGVQVAALFGMEHGFGGAAADGTALGDGNDAASGLPVFSLYGETKEPTAAMLAGVDVLLFDAQDVGVRFYTYVSNLYYVLRAAGKHGCALIVLDRPNPITGAAVEGPSIEPGFESFVGIAPMPIRHGLTVGEMARFFNAEHRLGADLTVIAMQGWQRDMWFDQTGLPWLPTSPAMPHLSTAIVYPGACLIEGTVVSEARGTSLPFEQLGAPWIDAQRLARELNALPIPGLHCRPTSFEPVAGKHAGQQCFGVQLHVTERQALQPVRMGLQLVATIKRLYPAEFAWWQYPRADGSTLFTIDRLIGSAAVRTALDAGVPAPAIIGGWQATEQAFRERRREYLLYT